MSVRFLPALLLKLLAAALAGLLLALWLPSLWGEVRLRWLLAGGVALGAALLTVAGVVLRSHGRHRDRDLDLSASELTTLTFPPEGRLQRTQRR